MDIQEITAREQVFCRLWNRMDRDERLIKNYDFVLRDFKSEGSGVIAKTYSVPVPLGGTHHSKYKSKLMKLKREYEVLSTKDELITDVISFLDDADAAVDEFNGNQVDHSPRIKHIDWVCSRGWVGERNLWRVEDGVLIPDTIALDPRNFVWWIEGGKLSQASVLSYRFPEDVNKTYGMNLSGDNLVEVRDCWNEEKECVWVNNDLVMEQDNPYGFVPFVIRPTSWGPILGSGDALEHRGESIFYPHRNMYDEVSFSASVAKTESREGLRPALQTKAKGPSGYPGGGDVVENQTEPLQIIPRTDMTNAQRTFMGMTSSIVQQNSWGMQSFGSISDPVSGDTVDALNAGNEDILASRIQCLEPFFADGGAMRLKQFVQLGGDFRLKQKKHHPDRLEGEFNIACHLIDDSIDTYARRGRAAASLTGIMPLKWLRQRIVQDQNPNEVDNEVEREQAEQQDPAQTMLERIYALIDKGDNLFKQKAQFELFNLETVLKQRKGQGVPEPMLMSKRSPRTMPANITAEETRRPV